MNCIISTMTCIIQDRCKLISFRTVLLTAQCSLSSDEISASLLTLKGNRIFVFNFITFRYLMSLILSHPWKTWNKHCSSINYYCPAVYETAGHIFFCRTITLWAISRDILRGPRLFWPIKLSRAPEKWLIKFLSPKIKIMSQSFVNGGTLVILCLFATLGPQFYSLIQAIILKMEIFKCLI